MLREHTRPTPDALREPTDAYAHVEHIARRGQEPAGHSALTEPTWEHRTYPVADPLDPKNLLSRHAINFAGRRFDFEDVGHRLQPQDFPDLPGHDRPRNRTFPPRVVESSTHYAARHRGHN